VGVVVAGEASPSLDSSEALLELDVSAVVAGGTIAVLVKTGGIPSVTGFTSAWLSFGISRGSADGSVTSELFACVVSGLVFFPGVGSKAVVVGLLKEVPAFGSLVG
jgi:hypothetical protein